METQLSYHDMVIEYQEIYIMTYVQYPYPYVGVAPTYHYKFTLVTHFTL